MYPSILDEQERLTYKREFDRDHQEYKSLQAELDNVNQNLSDLERELDQQPEGSPQFLVSEAIQDIGKKKNRRKIAFPGENMCGCIRNAQMQKCEMESKKSHVLECRLTYDMAEQFKKLEAKL